MSYNAVRIHGHLSYGALDKSQAENETARAASLLQPVSSRSDKRVPFTRGQLRHKRKSEGKRKRLNTIASEDVPGPKRKRKGMRFLLGLTPAGLLGTR
ncbi:hypothetical protein BaRGS_00013438 [Batillaria attramentaria]|uniref:Uncharacterized protein n=1 Tax=Batillaria attramentaria TaxID=370345 RepID=A0ABD0J9A5_9CAEN